LVDYAGGNSVAWKHFKSRTGWNAYSGIVNEDTYGFSALPGGNRLSSRGFYAAGDGGYWWTATENGASYAYYRRIHYNDEYVGRGWNSKSDGFAVRCVRD
jgi:uncharacterized protein (TIGR02145 family)